MKKPIEEKDGVTNMEAVEIKQEQGRNIKVIDELTAKLAQLEAMTAMIYGDGFEPFDSMNKSIKGNYLWACADMVSEARDLAGKL